jgi:hypothetical protein
LRNPDLGAAGHLGYGLPPHALRGKDQGLMNNKFGRQ